jgi:predicted GNAT family acetyltransferase
MSDMQVVHAEADRRYEILVGGKRAGSAHYRRKGDTVVFTHTEVGEEYEGHGVGSALARGALDDVRARGEQAIAECPFIKAYIEKHPEYQDLLAAV